ncbi:hypothetical protein J2787_002918 [Chryseobacterium rhizosphaerae]|uniref:Terpene synthase n=1 Tax=Chryseobacterium rhizosphaerae TaxID=395937 RepID=A0AAE3YCB0_9FLAO|nr:terpene synthase family protein [Chryseobacterium rhizosphaerae]MDR6527526.1 hypothetical protein [Chryseobacterium rhizosphaerae]
MEQYNYKSADYLPLGYYPWPDLINPHVDQMGRDMDFWIDNDYTFLTEKQREKYKRMKLQYRTARMLPQASYEQVLPCNKFMLFYIVLDDQLEHASLEEIEYQRDRFTAILKGDNPGPDENGLYRHVALLRDEYLAFMPAEWMERFIEDFYRATRYGIEVETPYKAAARPPSLALFKAIREYSVLMYPYLCWTEILPGFVIPKHISEHSVFQRIKALMVRVVAWQNDFHSLPKELAKKTEVFNLIIVLQEEYTISLEEACIKALRIHNEDLAELLELYNEYREFGVYQEYVDKYVYNFGLMIQGINTFYLQDTVRYLPGGVGFVWPEKQFSEDASL